MTKPDGEDNPDNDDGGTFEYRVDVPASEQRLSSTTPSNEQPHQRHQGKTVPQHHDLCLANGHRRHHKYPGPDQSGNNSQHQDLFVPNGHQHQHYPKPDYPGRSDPLQSENTQHQDLYLDNGHHQHPTGVGLYQYPGPDSLQSGNSQPQYLNGSQYPTDVQQNVVDGQQQYPTGTEQYRVGSEQYPASNEQSYLATNGHRYPSTERHQISVPPLPEPPREDNVDYNPDEDEAAMRTLTQNIKDRMTSAAAPGRQQNNDRRHHHHHHRHHQCRHRHHDATPDVIVTSPPVVEPKPPRYEQFTHV